MVFKFKAPLGCIQDTTSKPPPPQTHTQPENELYIIYNICNVKNVKHRLGREKAPSGP